MRKAFRRLCRWTEASPPLTRRQFLAAFALLFALVTVALYGVGTLVGANRNRLDDIQASRVESCKQSYEGIRKVFRPFFRPQAVRTAKERHDIAKFNRIVDSLTRRCPSQTQAKGAR